LISICECSLELSASTHEQPAFHPLTSTYTLQIQNSKSFRYQGVKIWNSVLDEFKLLTFNQLKLKYKAYLLSGYNLHRRLRYNLFKLYSKIYFCFLVNENQQDITPWKNFIISFLLIYLCLILLACYKLLFIHAK